MQIEQNIEKNRMKAVAIFEFRLCPSDTHTQSKYHFVRSCRYVRQ